MKALLRPLLAAAAIAQFQGGTLEGAVVDEGGKPLFNPANREFVVDR
jgi:hypothetical protein